MLNKIKLLIFIFTINCTLVIGANIKHVIYTPSQIDSIIKKTEVYIDKFQYTNALNCILKLKTYYISSNDNNGIIYCKIKLAEINRHATLFENSILYLKEAEKLIKLHPNEFSTNILMLYYNRKAALSSEYFNTPDSTLYYSNKALELAKKNNNQNIQFTSLQEIGHAQEVNENYIEAISFYKKAIDVADKIGDKHLKCDAMINLARVYSRSHQFNKAIQICNDGLFLLQNDTFYFQKLLFYDIKTKIYETLGDKTQAFDNLKQRMNYTELYYKENEIVKFKEINEKYQLKEKNLEIERNKEKIEREKNKQTLLLYISFLFLIGLISLIYYNSKLKKTSIKLKLLSKENEFLVQEANHRINNNLQLIIILITDELKKLNENENLSVKKILSKVESIATLHRQLYQQKNKNEIEISNYLNELKFNFDDLFEKKEIKINFHIQKHNVSINHAMYLGLILTELFINTLKYAFKNQSDRNVSVTLISKNKGYDFTYCDNDKDCIDKIIKPKLIDKLCKQLKVSYTIKTQNGYFFSFNKTTTRE